MALRISTITCLSISSLYIYLLYLVVKNTGTISIYTPLPVRTTPPTLYIQHICICVIYLMCFCFFEFFRSLFIESRVLFPRPIFNPKLTLFEYDTPSSTLYSTQLNNNNTQHKLFSNMITFVLFLFFFVLFLFNKCLIFYFSFFSLFVIIC